jgi:hypothetical protein
MRNLISVYLETVLVSVQDRCTLAPNVPLAQKWFWTHLMELLSLEAQVEAYFGPFRDSANLNARYLLGLR